MYLRRTVWCRRTLKIYLSTVPQTMFLQLEKYVQCSQEASDVVVVFAHKKGKTPVNTKLKMEICDVFVEAGRLTVMSEGYL